MLDIYLPIAQVNVDIFLLLFLSLAVGVLSGLFGVGGGWNAEEMANHGTTDFKNRFKLLDERLQAMRVIWTESKPKFDGDYVKFGPMMTWPKPVQKPHPPIIVGGGDKQLNDFMNQIAEIKMKRCNITENDLIEHRKKILKDLENYN